MTLSFQQAYKFLWRVQMFLAEISLNEPIFFYKPLHDKLSSVTGLLSWEKALTNGCSSFHSGISKKWFHKTMQPSCFRKCLFLSQVLPYLIWNIFNPGHIVKHLQPRPFTMFCRLLTCPKPAQILFSVSKKWLIARIMYKDLQNSTFNSNFIFIYCF